VGDRTLKCTGNLDGPRRWACERWDHAVGDARTYRLHWWPYLMPPNDGTGGAALTSYDRTYLSGAPWTAVQQQRVAESMRDDEGGDRG
jgi:hypothetical protein